MAGKDSQGRGIDIFDDIALTFDDVNKRIGYQENRTRFIVPRYNFLTTEPGDQPLNPIEGQIAVGADDNTLRFYVNGEWRETFTGTFERTELFYHTQNPNALAGDGTGIGNQIYIEVDSTIYTGGIGQSFTVLSGNSPDPSENAVINIQAGESFIAKSTGTYRASDITVDYRLSRNVINAFGTYPIGPETGIMLTTETSPDIVSTPVDEAHYPWPIVIWSQRLLLTSSNTPETSTYYLVLERHVGFPNDDSDGFNYRMKEGSSWVADL